MINVLHENTQTEIANCQTQEPQRIAVKGPSNHVCMFANA